MTTPNPIDALNGLDTASLRTSLDGAVSAEPMEIADAIAWIEGIRRDMVEVLSHIDDPTDLAMAAAIQYVELKSRWIGLNTKMNYAMFRSGSCIPGDQIRASVASALLASLEVALNPDDVNKITEFLAQPLKDAA